MWSKFRMWLSLRLLMIAIQVIDKKTLAGMSLLMALNDWLDYINGKQIKQQEEQVKAIQPVNLNVK